MNELEKLNKKLKNRKKVIWTIIWTMVLVWILVFWAGIVAITALCFLAGMSLVILIMFPTINKLIREIDDNFPIG